MTSAMSSGSGSTEGPAGGRRGAATARKTSRTPRIRPGRRWRRRRGGRGPRQQDDRDRHGRADQRGPDDGRRMDDRIEQPRRRRGRSRATTASAPSAPAPGRRRRAASRQGHLVDLAVDDPPRPHARLAGRRVGLVRRSARRAGTARPGRRRGRCRSATARPGVWVCEWTIPQKTSSASSVATVRRSRSSGSIS